MRIRECVYERLGGSPVSPTFSGSGDSPRCVSEAASLRGDGELLEAAVQLLLPLQNLQQLVAHHLSPNKHMQLFSRSNGHTVDP